MQWFDIHAPLEFQVNRRISASSCSAVFSLHSRAIWNACNSQRDFESGSTMREAMELNHPNVQFILDTLVGSLSTSAGEGNCLLQDQNYEPLYEGRWGIWEFHRLHLVQNPSGKKYTCSPIDVCVWERTRRATRRASLRSWTTRCDDYFERNQF